MSGFPSPCIILSSVLTGASPEGGNVNDHIIRVLLRNGIPFQTQSKEDWRIPSERTDLGDLGYPSLDYGHHSLRHGRNPASTIEQYVGIPCSNSRCFICSDASDIQLDMRTLFKLPNRPACFPICETQSLLPDRTAFLWADHWTIMNASVLAISRETL